jgi:hypothetical protein
VIRGRLQRHEGVVNVIAEHIAPLSMAAPMVARNFR